LENDHKPLDFEARYILKQTLSESFVSNLSVSQKKEIVPFIPDTFEATGQRHIF